MGGGVKIIVEGLVYGCGWAGELWEYEYEVDWCGDGRGCDLFAEVCNYCGWLA